MLSSISNRRVGNMIQRQQGGTMVGFIVGLVVGLAIALAVALAITKGPMPFINKVSPSGTAPVSEEAAAGKLPDPNKSLYSKDTPVVPVPSTPSVASPALTEPHADVPGSTVNYLQAGAFRTAADAENMKAKLALLGFEAQTAPTKVNDETLYRVRLGPYGRIDDLNRVRQRLTENGIDVALVSGG